MTFGWAVLFFLWHQLRPLCGFSWQLGLLDSSEGPGSCAWFFSGEVGRHTQLGLSIRVATHGGLREVRLLRATGFPETEHFKKKEAEGVGLAHMGPLSPLP